MAGLPWGWVFVGLPWEWVVVVLPWDLRLERAIQSPPQQALLPLAVAKELMCPSRKGNQCIDLGYIDT